VPDIGWLDGTGGPARPGCLDETGGAPNEGWLDGTGGPATLDGPARPACSGGARTASEPRGVGVCCGSARPSSCRAFRVLGSATVSSSEIVVPGFAFAFGARRERGHLLPRAEAPGRDVGRGALVILEHLRARGLLLRLPRLQAEPQPRLADAELARRVDRGPRIEHRLAVEDDRRRGAGAAHVELAAVEVELRVLRRHARRIDLPRPRGAERDRSERLSRPYPHRPRPTGPDNDLDDVLAGNLRHGSGAVPRRVGRSARQRAQDQAL
jgi:hypothetical protein